MIIICRTLNYELFPLVSKLHEIRHVTRLKSTSRHFTVETATSRPNDSFLSLAICRNSFRLLPSLITTAFKNLNGTSIAIFSLLQSTSYVVLYSILPIPSLFFQKPLGTSCIAVKGLKNTIRHLRRISFPSLSTMGHSA